MKKLNCYKSMKFLACILLRVFILSFTLNVGFTSKVYAEQTLTTEEKKAIRKDIEDRAAGKDTKVKATEPKDVLGTIIDILQNLTCETQGIGNLLRTEFSHTCIPAPFFTFAVMNLVSPAFYMNMFLRLKINNFNDPEFFDSPAFPNGQCTRQDRADGNNPELSFGICSNILLTIERVKAIPEAAMAIAKAILTGSDPWDDIEKLWKNKAKDYHNIYTKKPEESGVMFDVGLPIPWKVIQDNDKICLATIGFTGYVPVGCKYIKEPFPWSMYGSFMDISGGSPASASSTDPTDPLKLVACSTGSAGGGCYQRAYNASKTAVVITAPLIECIRQMTARLLISDEVCTFEDINQVINSPSRATSALFQFQVGMHKIVTALLTLYVMFFGMKLILGGQVPQKAEFINFILKMLFVTYFSIGINITPGSTSPYDRMDGMIQFAFPFLLDGINTLAGWVINASPSDLCKFNGPNIQYDSKMAYVALWDALDCRIAHYIGLDMLSTLLVENAYRSHDIKNFDFFSFSAPPYIYLLIPAIISGSMTLVSLALAYPLLVISVGAFMVNATVMCMISIVILGVLAPLFVPMFLFQYTRNYFEAWVKLLISFLLQPMVIVTFMITMFSVYDFGFYGHCKYNSKLINNSIKDKLQNGIISKRDVLIFYINNDWSQYSKEEADSCKNSLGYMLNNPLATIFNFGKDSLDEIVQEKPGTTDTKTFLDKFQFLSSIVLSPGMLFTSPKVLFEKIKDIMLALITACFTLYLMYNFSSQLAEFAADMTEGVALNNVAIKPQAIFKAAMAAISAAGQVKDGGLGTSGGGKREGGLGASGGGREQEGGLGTSGGGGEQEGGLGASGGGVTQANMSRSNTTTGSISNLERVLSNNNKDHEQQNRTDKVLEEKQTPEEAEKKKQEDEKRKQEEEKRKQEEEKRRQEMETKAREEQKKQEDTEIKAKKDKEEEEEERKKARRAYGLDDSEFSKQESHTLKQGEAGYVKQEMENAKIREEKATWEKERDETLRSGGGRAGPNNQKLDKGSDENV